MVICILIPPLSPSILTSFLPLHKDFLQKLLILPLYIHNEFNWQEMWKYIPLEMVKQLICDKEHIFLSSDNT